MFETFEQRVTFKQLLDQYDLDTVKEYLMKELAQLALSRVIADEKTFQRFDEVQYLLMLALFQEKNPTYRFMEEVMHREATLNLPQIPEKEELPVWQPTYQVTEPLFTAAPQPKQTTPKEKKPRKKKDPAFQKPKFKEKSTTTNGSNGQHPEKQSITDGYAIDDEEEEIIPPDEELFNLSHPISFEDDEGDVEDDDSETTYNPTEAMREFISATNGSDTVGIGLKELCSMPLLTVEEEQDIGRRIERGRLAQKMLQDMRSSEGYDEDEAYVENKHLILAEEDMAVAIDHLIRANTRLVVSIAKKHIGRGVPFLDLIQEGILGLIHAVEKFEPKKGFKFSTYATWWIRQKVSRSVEEQSRPIRIPVHKWNFASKMRNAERTLTQQSGEVPTLAQIAEEILKQFPTKELLLAQNLTETEHQQIYEIELRKMTRHVTDTRLEFRLTQSTNEPVGDDGDSELGEFLSDNSDGNNTVEDEASNNILKDLIRAALDKLPEREALILTLRYGLDDGQDRTLEQVAQRVGVTRERVRQLEAQAFKRIKMGSLATSLKDNLS